MLLNIYIALSSHTLLGFRKLKIKQICYYSISLLSILICFTPGIYDLSGFLKVDSVNLNGLVVYADVRLCGGDDVNSNYAEALDVEGYALVEIHSPPITSYYLGKAMS